VSTSTESLTLTLTLGTIYVTLSNISTNAMAYKCAEI